MLQTLLYDTVTVLEHPKRRTWNTLFDLFYFWIFGNKIWQVTKLTLQNLKFSPNFCPFSLFFSTVQQEKIRANFCRWWDHQTLLWYQILLVYKMAKTKNKIEVTWYNSGNVLTKDLNRKEKHEIRKLKPVILLKFHHPMSTLRLAKKNENTETTFFPPVLCSQLYEKTVHGMKFIE